MLQRILSLTLVAAITLAGALPAFAKPMTQGQQQGTLTFASPRPFTVQGEVAYVLNGDLYLHDLATDVVRRLTTDGQAMLPAWSPDGSRLLYSRGPSVELADLYVLDVTRADAEPQLVAEDACCGGWMPNGNEIVYVNLAAPEPQIVRAGVDGSDVISTGVTLAYGAGAYPLGNVHAFGTAEGSVDLLVTVEYLDNRPNAGFAVLPGLFGVTSGGELVPFDAGAITISAYSQDGREYLAAVGGQCRPDLDQMGCANFASSSTNHAITYDVFGASKRLPDLGYPALAPGGGFLAAERYLPAATPDPDPNTVARAGVAIVRVGDGVSYDLRADAAQPAWRPAATVDPLAQGLAVAGEFVVTIDPPLSLEGHTYRVSYMTTGTLRTREARFFTVLTPDYFARQQITGLVVTQDDERIVTDLQVAQQILTLYSAAYSLYNDVALTDYPRYAEELNKVLNNPVFMALAPGEFLSVNPDEFIGSRRTQTAEALRLLLQDPGALTVADRIMADAVAQSPVTVEELVQLVDSFAEKEYAYHHALGTLSQDLTATLQDLDMTAAQAESYLFLLQLMARMLLAPGLSAQRAELLTAYMTAHRTGPAALDREQLRAAAEVLNEVDAVYQQRVAIAVEFGRELIESGLLRVAERVGVDAAAQLAGQVGAYFGNGLAGHAVAGVLSAAGIGLTIGNILYGGSGLVAHYRLAQRSEELRDVFATGRAAAHATALSAWSQGMPYSAQHTAAYRDALLLESLAALQTQREYALGVAATFALPNPVRLVNWIRGEDWQATVHDLITMADRRERELAEALVAPPWLPPALTLLRGPAVVSGERNSEPIAAGLARLQTILPDFDVRYVPEGPFTMGSDDGYSDEQPVHVVDVDAFWMGLTEVSNAQYRPFVQAGGYDDASLWTAAGWAWRTQNGVTAPICWDEARFSAPEQPVVCVSWYEVMAYVAWLSRESGLQVRLPTEAEWEKAARGTDGRTYPWGDEFDMGDSQPRLNFCDVNCEYDWKDAAYDDGYAYTAPVGSYPAGASPFGLLDLAGNVWEWTSTLYADYPYAADDGREFVDDACCRVVRGGSWYSDINFVRAAYRFRDFPGSRFNNLGVRVVVAPQLGR